jgi:hypothetical protein
MAIQLNFSSLSVGASVDQQTGNLSIFEVIEEIRAAKLPIQLPSVVVSLALRKTTPNEGAEGQFFLHLITPDGKQHKVGNGDLRVPAERNRMKAVFRLAGFPIQQFGEHRMVVSISDATGVKQGEAIFDFEVIEAPQLQTAAETQNGDQDRGVAH